MDDDLKHEVLYSCQIIDQHKWCILRVCHQIDIFGIIDPVIFFFFLRRKKMKVLTVVVIVVCVTTHIINGSVCFRVFVVHDS